MKQGKILLFLILFSPASSWGALQGPAIQNNQFRVDLTQGPILGPNRKVAMGGAFVAVAEGVGGITDNPASVAFRPPHSTGKLDWDFTLGSLKASGDDFDNNGNDSIAYDDHQVTTVGALLQYKRFGFGFFVITQSLEVTDQTVSHDYDFLNGYIALGGDFKNKQWIWGFGIRPATLEVKRNGDSRILKLSGSGANLGLLWHPKRGPFRLGVSYFDSIESNQSLIRSSTAPASLNGLILPSEVALASEWAFGASYHFKKGRFKDRPLLVAADLRTRGRTREAVGIESFLEQTVQKSGEKATFSFHTGLEWEAFPRRFRIRAGTYNEPSRFTAGSARQHIAGGFQWRLFKLKFWGNPDISLSYAFDVSRDYSNNFISLGFWTF